MVAILKSKKNKIILATIFLLAFVINANFCSADNLLQAFDSKLNNVAGKTGAGYNTTGTVTAESMISLIVTTILSFLGVIFLVLAIYGGFIWMMARGNEQEVEKAKQIIQNSVIGLIIVVAAYAVSWYIINAFSGALI